uniref:Pyrrolo-quinoline quinone repeat domain-containing protein n=1 Tax=Guillardia theta TaxID=55529 RepID=A0A7S4UAD2_GUITH|mmetsp:Transcript_46290/g.145180  ORF Transcript_46290/g.145180 Transcript_46290/m.145180 type:complete len:379 (+) Transcript_46290:249-1385(+)
MKLKMRSCSMMPLTSRLWHRELLLSLLLSSHSLIIAVHPGDDNAGETGRELSTRFLPQGADGKVILVGTLDGKMHALDSEDGAKLWEVDTGGWMVSTYQNSTSMAGNVIIPTLSGDILIYSSSSQSPLHKLPVSLHDLVDHSPFVSKDGYMYVGTKASEYFTIDGRTGSSRRASANPLQLDASPVADRAAQEADWRLLLGRKDLRVSAIDPSTGRMSWNATLSFFSDLKVRSLQQDSLSPLDDLAKPVPLRIVTTAGGGAHAIDPHTGERRWTAHLSAPVLRAFQVSGGRRRSMEVGEVEVVASTAVEENHYVDEDSQRLQEDAFLFVSSLNHQLYARGSVIAGRMKPLLPVSASRDGEYGGEGEEEEERDEKEQSRE